MEKGLSILNFIFNWGGGGGSLPQVRVKKTANSVFITSILEELLPLGQQVPTDYIICFIP